MTTKHTGPPWKLKTFEGMRGYLCVRGGIELKPILGSRSALTPLRAGDELECAAGTIHGRFLRPNWTWNTEPRALRAVDGSPVWGAGRTPMCRSWLVPMRMFPRG